MEKLITILWVLFGSLLGCVSAGEKSPQQIAAEMAAASKPLKVKIEQVLPNGILVKVLPASVERGGETFYLPDCWKSEELVFLHCDSKGMIDGQIKQWREVYPAGRIQYESVIGATKTVQAFTLSYKQHLKFKAKK
jgi:hypothetical protein